MTAAPSEGAREWMPSAEERDEFIREFAEMTLSLHEIRERMDSMLTITGLRAQRDAHAKSIVHGHWTAAFHRTQILKIDMDIAALEAGKGK